MAMKTLQEMRAVLKEPQLLHKWTIEVPTWPSAIAPSNPDILFLVTSSALPEPEEEDAMVELGGYKLANQGKTNRNGTISWTFVENTDGEVIKYFFVDYANKRQNFESEANISMKSSTNAELFAPIVNMNLYAADGQTVVKQCKLINVQFKPKSPGGELGQEVAVAKPTIDVTFDSHIWVKV